MMIYNFSFSSTAVSKRKQYFTSVSPGFLLVFFFSFPEDGVLIAVLCPGMPGTRTLLSEFTTGVFT